MDPSTAKSHLESHVSIWDTLYHSLSKLIFAGYPATNANGGLEKIGIGGDFLWMFPYFV